MAAALDLRRAGKARCASDERRVRARPDAEAGGLAHPSGRALPADHRRDLRTGHRAAGARRASNDRERDRRSIRSAHETTAIAWACALGHVLDADNAHARPCRDSLHLSSRAAELQSLRGRRCLVADARRRARRRGAGRELAVAARARRVHARRHAVRRRGARDAAQPGVGGGAAGRGGVSRGRRARAPAPPQVEHDPPARGRGRCSITSRRDCSASKLAGLEAGDLARVPGGAGLSRACVRRARGDRRARVLDAGLGPAAARGDPPPRHREDRERGACARRGRRRASRSRSTTRRRRRSCAARTATWDLPPPLGKLAIAWVEAHGLAGQHVRGEGPILMFAPLVGALRDLAPALGRALGVEPHRAIALALDGLHVLNACDTAAVREGLLDDALLGKLARVRDQL